MAPRLPCPVSRSGNHDAACDGNAHGKACGECCLAVGGGFLFHRQLSCGAFVGQHETRVNRAIGSMFLRNRMAEESQHLAATHLPNGPALTEDDVGHMAAVDIDKRQLLFRVRWEAGAIVGYEFDRHRTDVTPFRRAKYSFRRRGRHLASGRRKHLHFLHRRRKLVTETRDGEESAAAPLDAVRSSAADARS